MKKTVSAALCGTAAMFAAAGADAAKFDYRFTYEQVNPFTGQGIGDLYTVAGRLDANEIAPFVYEITGATGTFSSNFNPSMGSVAGVGESFGGAGPGFVLLGDFLLGFGGTFYGDRILSVDYAFFGGIGNGIESFGPITEASLTRVTAGVPEPATWGLMILGFGAVGAAMRRRASVKATVRFA